MAKVKSKRAYWGIMGASALSMLLTLGGGMSYSEPQAAAQRTQARASANMDTGALFHAEAPAVPPPVTQCDPGKAIIAIAYVVGQQGDTGEFQCFCGAQEAAKATATALPQGKNGLVYGVSAGDGTQGSGALSAVANPSNPQGYATGTCIIEAQTLVAGTKGHCAVCIRDSECAGGYTCNAFVDNLGTTFRCSTRAEEPACRLLSP